VRQMDAEASSILLSLTLVLSINRSNGRTAILLTGNRQQGGQLEIWNHYKQELESLLVRFRIILKKS